MLLLVWAESLDGVQQRRVSLVAQHAALKAHQFTITKEEDDICYKTSFVYNDNV